jgi:hypothetical protein
MTTPETGPVAAPSTSRAVKWRRPLMLGCALLAAASAAALVLAGVEKVRDAADRST